MIQRNQQGRVLLRLEFYWLYLPFLSLVDMLPATHGGFGTQLDLLPLSLVDMLRATCGSFDTRVYLPFLQRICFKQLVEVSVLSCSLTSLWPASFLLYACQILWFLSLVSFSLPCLGAFFLLFLVLSWRFWTIYIYIFKCLNLWNIFFFVIVKSNDMKESS